MTLLVLYTTVGCHLCEQALELITPLLPVDCELKLVDIADVDDFDVDDLMERYGIRIPVVQRTDTEGELGWPFDQQQFIAFLQ
jgi:Glutaredoxin-like domain (DUF836)